MNNSENKKINLTVVSAYFYPKIGGLETIAYTTAKKLQESGKYNVSIITSNYSGSGYKEEILNGMTVYRLPILFTLSNTPINPFWFFKIKEILKKEKTDIVHTHSPVPLMADLAVFIAKRLNIKVVSTYHSGSMKKGKFFSDIIIYVYEKYFLRKMFERADKVVTVHQRFMDINYSEFKYKTSFIPTGVDLERFRFTDLNQDNKIVTFIGRIELSSKWKGIDQLLLATKEVVKRIPNVKIQLVGGGDALSYYRDMSSDLGVSENVNILGPKYGDDLVKIYQDSTVVVLPSTSDSEAFSVTLVESMASGRPIIGTNIGGTPQVIKDGVNGLLVEPKNPHDLAVAIIKILSDFDFAMQLGKKGFEISKDFTWDNQIGKYEKLFSGILNK